MWCFVAAQRASLRIGVVVDTHLQLKNPRDERETGSRGKLERLRRKGRVVKLGGKRSTGIAVAIDWGGAHGEEVDAGMGGVKKKGRADGRVWCFFGKTPQARISKQIQAACLYVQARRGLFSLSTGYKHIPPPHEGCLSVSGTVF